MRQMILAAAMVLAMSATATAQSFTLGQPLTAVWTGAANETDAAVTAYQVRVDTGAWTPSGQSVPQTEYRYAIPQALLTLGAHTISVRACAGATCGTDEAQVSITIGRPLPGRPRTPSVVPSSGQAVLSLPRAVEIANAYATLTVDRNLTGQELSELAKRHGNAPPTRESVFKVLDASFAELVGSR